MKSPLTLLLLIALPVAAEDLDFYRDIYPFLKANCIACHNKTTTKAGLDMESPETMKKGGDSGPSLIPGKGAESLVVLASEHKEDMEMPPTNNKAGAVKLTPKEIELFIKWIDQGAKSSVQEVHKVVLQSISAGLDPIYCVATTTDGRYAACGRAGHIYIYDLASRTVSAEIKNAHKGMVQSLAFTADGTQLASGSYREIKLWQLSTVTSAGSPLSVKEAPADLLKKVAAATKQTVISSALSQDGKTLATGQSDGSIKLWEAATLKLLSELKGSLDAEKKKAALDWTIAQQTLEQAFQKAEVARIDTQDKALDVLLGKAKDAIVAMNKALPEKEKALKPANETRTAAQKAVDDLAAKAKTDTAAAAQLKTAQDKLITAKMTETSAVAAVAATKSNIKDAEEEIQRINQSKAENAKKTAAANATISASKAIQDKATAELTKLAPALTQVGGKALALTFSQDGSRLAAMREDGILRVWGVGTGLVVAEASASSSAPKLTASTSGGFTVTRSFELPAAPQWVLRRTIDGNKLFSERVNALAFSPDGKQLAAGSGEPSRSGEVVFFDVASGNVARTWKEVHTDSVLTLCFSPDGKLLATGSADKIARVTDVASGKTVRSFEGHTHHVNSVSFRADGRVLATAGADGVVASWDMQMGERKKKIEGWTKEVTSVQFIGATNQIVASSGDNRLRIVTDDGGEIRSMANLPDYMQSSAASASGKVIVGGGEDSCLRVFDGATGKEVIAFQNTTK
ncbi:MAG: hypothetical protein JNJ83_00220 [Verrucomicrobiaceae bacterium]|nr:hypothetical protein [Verrucomicrobiaceae bacterium]